MTEHLLGGHWADVEAELAQLAAPARSSSSIRSRLCNTTCLVTKGPKLLFVADSIEKLLLGMRGVWLRHVGIENERQAHLQSTLLGAEARVQRRWPAAQRTHDISGQIEHCCRRAFVQRRLVDSAPSLRHILVIQCPFWLLTQGALPGTPLTERRRLDITIFIRVAITDI